MIKDDYHTIKDTEFVIQCKATPNQIILIENFPNNDQLLDTFLAPLGTPIQESRNQDERSIFQVTVQNIKGCFTSYATSNLFFPVHTDGSDFKIPPAYVAMYCVKPSQEGGESLFVSLPDLMTHLPEELIDILSTKMWTFNTVKRTILSQTATGFSICYNRLIMESYSELTKQELDLLDQLDRVCEAHTFRVKLKENDLIIFRNDLFLHGRTGFPLNSNRLLKRIRFRENTLLSERNS